MYAFPSVAMPERAVKDAAANKIGADTLYALSLLEETGICVVPASGFGQSEGRHGFRTTFLPPEAQMENVVAGFKAHHEKFVEKWA